MLACDLPQWLTVARGSRLSDVLYAVYMPLFWDQCRQFCAQMSGHPSARGKGVEGCWVSKGPRSHIEASTSLPG